MFRFVYNFFSFGGVETLIARVGNYCAETENEAVIYCKDIISDIKAELKLNRVKVVIADKPSRQAIKDYKDGDFVITFLLNDFFLCEAETKNKKDYYKIICYVVHINGLVYITKYRWLNKILFSLNRDVLFSYITNNQILFMDKQCFESTKEYYDFKNLDSSDYIIHLPMQDIQTDSDSIKRRSIERKKEFTILTVFRSEFPFKGYVKELVYICAYLNKSFPRIKLILVTSDEDTVTLEKWVKESKKDGFSNIHIYKNIRPSKLANLYNVSSLYIGMGTTVLEAASYGVIPITVEPYIYQCKTSGFFYDNPDIIATDIGKGKDILEFIVKIINMPDDEYILKSYECQKIYKDLYSMHNFNNRLMKIKKTNIHYIKLIQIFEAKLYGYKH